METVLCFSQDGFSYIGKNWFFPFVKGKNKNRENNDCLWKGVNITTKDLVKK